MFLVTGQQMEEMFDPEKLNVASAQPAVATETKC